MLRKTTLFALFILLGVSSTATVSFGQVVDLIKPNSDYYDIDDYGVDFVSFVRIAPGAGEISPIEKTNTLASLDTQHGNSSINRDGSVIVTWIGAADEKVVTWRETERGELLGEVRDVPGSGDPEVRSYDDPRLDREGKTILYHADRFIAQVPRGLDDWDSDIVVADLANDRVIARFTVREVYDGLIDFEISPDGETIAYTYLTGAGEKLFVVEREGADFSSPVHLGTLGVTAGLRVASDRVFYRGTVTGSTGMSVPCCYSQRTDAGWSEPIPIELPEGLVPERVYDIADNGRTLLVCAGEKGLALTHETATGWSEPEYIGYVPYQGDRIEMSDDARVVAMSTARRPFPEFRSVHERAAYMPIYDLFVFLPDADGSWTRSQVSSSQYPVSGGEYLLSGDGRLLFWVPETWRPLSGVERWREQ
ncbi:MAG: hypothetical protein J7M38_10485 [Armatimonadetes bacterium]|nr:hypothetical protein [Armatimonadota bacterium]